MPFKFTVDSAQSLIYRRVWGVYDDDQAAASMAEFLTLAQHELDELRDLRQVSDYRLSPAFMTRLARENADRRQADEYRT